MSDNKKENRSNEKKNPPDITELLIEFGYKLGEFIVLDDIKDYGKFDRVHHWQIGELIRVLSLYSGVAYKFLKSLEKWLKEVNALGEELKE